jgi:hypothetical protein
MTYGVDTFRTAQILLWAHGEAALSELFDRADDLVGKAVVDRLGR